MEEFIRKLLTNFVELTIFSLMLSLGLNLTIKQVTLLWRKPKILLTFLLAVDVLVPIVTLLIVLLLVDLPPAVKIGLILLAVCPGAPLTTRKIVQAKGYFPYAVSFQVTVSLLAVITVPLLLAILSFLFPPNVDILPRQVAEQVTFAQLLPISIGIAIRETWPQLADEMGKPLTKIANVMFIVLVIFVLVKSLDIVLGLSFLSVVAIIFMTVVSLAIGHLLGGPREDTRTALAVFCATRNPGLALLIASLNFPELGVLPILIAYVLVGALAAIPYLTWRKRIAAQRAKAEAEMEI